jgi:hypothetical protein
MSTSRDGAVQATLDKLLEDYGLASDTRLYREVAPEALITTDTPGVFRIHANRAPSESVVDVYGQGHLVQAEQVGPGLAFAESASPNWQETIEMRTLKNQGTGGMSLPPIEVEVQLKDILQQGGLVYPVESVTVERVWYCTLPEDGIDVRAVS